MCINEDWSARTLTDRINPIKAKKLNHSLRWMVQLFYYFCMETYVKYISIII